MPNDIKKIIKKYAEELKRNDFLFKDIYVFGSYASGKANEESDIDVAVVSDKLKKYQEKNEILLWRAGRKVDSRIEPIGFSVKDFKDKCNPMVYEIKKHGIKIV
jgi:predicted nucleotidyltransferase